MARLASSIRLATRVPSPSLASAAPTAVTREDTISASAIVPKLLAAALAALLLLLGVTTYTLPNHGGAGYSDLHDLFARALGDSEPRLPGPPASLRIQILADSAAASPASVSPAAIGLDSSQPQRWIAQAVHQDSSAIRSWLGAAVLATSTVEGDTAHTTLWRLTLHAGCPLVSRLHATSAGVAVGTARLVRVRGDCPRELRKN